MTGGPSRREQVQAYPLPLAVRRSLWTQTWQRLLTPIEADRMRADGQEDSVDDAPPGPTAMRGVDLDALSSTNGASALVAGADMMTRPTPSDRRRK
jgi:hypothetical protein